MRTTPDEPRRQGATLPGHSPTHRQLLSVPGRRTQQREASHIPWHHRPQTCHAWELLLPLHSSRLRPILLMSVRPSWQMWLWFLMTMRCPRSWSRVTTKTTSPGGSRPPHRAPGSNLQNPLRLHLPPRSQLRLPFFFFFLLFFLFFVFIFFICFLFFPRSSSYSPSSASSSSASSSSPSSACKRSQAESEEGWEMMLRRAEWRTSDQRRRQALGTRLMGNRRAVTTQSQERPG